MKVGAEDLVYRAAPGELNQVTVRAGRKSVEISDPGAVIDAPGCKRADQHRVACPREAFVDVRTGDGDDKVALGSDAGGDVEIARVALGPGADRVDVTGGVTDTYLRGGAGPDTLNGGPSSSDTVDYSDATGPVHVDLGAGSSGVANEDHMANIDGAIGGRGSDTLVGNAADNQLIGGPGSDLINGGDGHDELEGDRGNDTLFGAGGIDEINGGDGHDLLFGGAGNDMIDTFDPVKGRDSADIVGCGAGSDFVAEQRPRHARVRDSDLLTTDCEEVLLDPGGSVLVTPSPLSATGLTLGFRYDDPPRKGTATSLLAKDGPRFLAGGRKRIKRRGTIHAPLSPEGRQLAAQRITTPVLIRLRLGKRTTAFRLLVPPPS